MKRCLFVLLLIIAVTTSPSATIVNNSGTTGEDSLTVTLPMNSDSAGAAFIGCDSFWVVIVKSGTDAHIFADSGIASTMVGMDSIADFIDGVALYYWHRAVADIDGSGASGGYSGVLVGKNITYQLSAQTVFDFQVTNFDLTYLWDSAATADEVAGEVWRNRDTLDVDSSDIGLWLVHNLSGTSGLTAAEIIDTLFDRLLADTVEGTLLSNLTRWANKINEVLDSLQSQDNWVGNVRYTMPDSILRVAGFYAIGNDADTGIFFIKNLNATGYGLYSYAASAGAFFQGNFVGLRAQGSQDAGIYALGNPYGVHFQGSTADAHGLYLSGGVSSGYALYYDAPTSRATNVPFVASDTNKLGEVLGLMPDDWTAADSAAFQGEGGSCTGDGPYTVRLYVIDTSGTDDSLYQAMLYVQSITGSAIYGPILTNSNGFRDFSLSADSFRVVAWKSGYHFDTDTIVIAADDSMAIEGYNTFIAPSPPGGNLCTVYGYITDQKEQPLVDAEVIFTLPSETKNICDSVIVVPLTLSAKTNASGYFEQDLTKSSCLADDNDSTMVPYTVTIKYMRRTGAVIEKRQQNLVIPSDSSTYKLFY